MTERSSPWEMPGYGDITAARMVDSDVEVTFANAEKVRLSLAAYAIGDATAASVTVEDGISILVSTTTHQKEISWLAIRSATDPAFRDHLERIGKEEQERIGARLKALREDRRLSLGELANRTGMAAKQLGRIEKGEEKLSTGKLKTLLDSMAASIADIAGPDALEVSVRAIVGRASKAGVDRELLSQLSKSVPRHLVPALLSKSFSWSISDILSRVPATPQLPVAVQFKAQFAKELSSSPTVHLALATSRLARKGFRVGPYRGVPNDPRIIRDEAVDETGQVTLHSLLEWSWSRGIPVLPLFGRGDFAAAVFEVDKAPAIVIKETRDLVPFWLFDLAHELGHVGLGHIQHALIDVESPTNPKTSDADERAATKFALSLLFPNHEELLEQVRSESRGSHVEFKFAVERVAQASNVSPGLLGVVAAYALPTIGEAKDRWGSATNLAKQEGSGRETTRLAAMHRGRIELLAELDAALIRAVVLHIAETE